MITANLLALPQANLFLQHYFTAKENSHYFNGTLSATFDLVRDHGWNGTKASYKEIDFSIATVLHTTDYEYLLIPLHIIPFRYLT